jgi:nucleoside-diphosphate-sugar epimerase
MRLPSSIVDRLRSAYEGEHVCVTGGAGFIGGHVVDTLLSVGARISVIDDLSNSSLFHLAELIELEPDRVRFVQGSILEDEALAQAMEGVQVVVHLAAVGSVPLSIDQPERSWEVNATGTVRVLEASRRVGVRRVVFAASSSAYGDTETLPKVETMTARPLSPYAVSKLAGEHLMRVWSGCYGLSTASVRYFNIFGPRQSADSAYAAVISAFAKRLLAGEPPVIYGDGEQSRDFTFVSNAVVATLLAGASDRKLAGEVINVGTGRSISLLELAGRMGELAAADGSMVPEPIHEKPRAGDVKHSLADISRAKELLGYEPIVSFEDGLRETFAWYRSVLSGA